MYKILEKTPLNPTVTKMVIEAPLVAKKAEPGQFIIFRASEDGERVPLTIADYDRKAGTVTIIFQIVGGATMELNALNAGDSCASRDQACRRWTLPCAQSTATIRPSRMWAVAPTAPTMVGLSRALPAMAAWLFRPASSTTRAAASRT